MKHLRGSGPQLGSPTARLGYPGAQTVGLLLLPPVPRSLRAAGGFLMVRQRVRGLVVVVSRRGVSLYVCERDVAKPPGLSSDIQRGNWAEHTGNPLRRFRPGNPPAARSCAEWPLWGTVAPPLPAGRLSFFHIQGGKYAFSVGENKLESDQFQI